MIRALFLALALTACAPASSDRQANERAALDMIRMGYVQWVAACAWQHGRNRLSSPPPSAVVRSISACAGHAAPFRTTARKGAPHDDAP
jgi:hypothetical protein